LVSFLLALNLSILQKSLKGLIHQALGRKMIVAAVITPVHCHWATSPFVFKLGVCLNQCLLSNIFREVYFFIRYTSYHFKVLAVILRGKNNMKVAEIHTKKGVMKIKFFEKDAPNTVKNFIDLAEHNFYDGLIFHRVIPNFMIQGGCPNGIGNGGPGYKINCELTGDNQYHDRGVLSMAHAGRNTGGSQFFICHSRENTKHLDRNHTVFGKVYEGLDVIDQIRQGDVMERVVIKEAEAI